MFSKEKDLWVFTFHHGMGVYMLLHPRPQRRPVAIVEAKK